MSPISFPADLYGAADWAFTHPKDLPNGLLKQVLVDARSGVLEELHRSYFNAVELYNLSPHTERWIDKASLQPFAQEAGKIYVTLDYFAVCLPLPRRMKKLRSGKEAIFYKHLCQRGLDNLQANSTALLRALAISSLIPDEWFPQKNLETLIEKEIKRSGIYNHVEIDLDLGLPPGGLHWLSDATMETVKRVREKLAAGQPWPVRIVRSPGRLDGNRQVVVYGCHEQKCGKLRLEIFEPGCSWKEHAFQVVTKGKRLKVTEILGPDRHLPVLGLLYEVYSPAPLPGECIPWWLRWMALRRVWMKLLAWMQKKRLLRFF